MSDKNKTYVDSVEFGVKVRSDTLVSGTVDDRDTSDAVESEIHNWI